LGPELRSGGSINVGEEKGKAGDSRGKMNRQSMCGAARTDKGERRIRPSSQDSPGSTINKELFFSLLSSFVPVLV
jgi:hypothetical protein